MRTLEKSERCEKTARSKIFEKCTAMRPSEKNEKYEKCARSQNFEKSGAMHLL